MNMKISYEKESEQEIEKNKKINNRAELENYWNKIFFSKIKFTSSFYQMNANSQYLSLSSLGGKKQLIPRSTPQPFRTTTCREFSFVSRSFRRCWPNGVHLNRNSDQCV